MALTRPDASADRRRLSETTPETTVGSTGPPHALHLSATVLVYPSGYSERHGTEDACRTSTMW